MAIWQYSFIIVPKANLVSIGCTNLIEKDQYNSQIFWNGNYFLKDFEMAIRRVLPKGNSWSPDINLFGRENSNCIEVITEDSEIREISFRYDFAYNNVEILNNVVDFCILNGLAMIAENYSIVPLNLESIMSIITHSDQYKFFIKIKSSPPFFG